MNNKKTSTTGAVPPTTGTNLYGMLFEDGDYSYDGMSFHDDSPTPYDMGGGSGGSGYAYGGIGRDNTFMGSTVLGMFINPALDVAKTALWGAKYLATKVKYITAALVGGAVAGLIPGTDAKVGGHTRSGVSRVFSYLAREEQDELKNINKQYEDVLKRNLEALQNGDALSVLFLLAPAKFVAATLAMNAPGSALEIADTATGGLASDLLGELRRTYYRQSRYEHQHFVDEDSNDSSSGAQRNDDSVQHGEEKEQPSTDSPPTAEEMEKVFADPRMKKAMASSPMFGELKQVGKKILSKRVDKVAQAKTLADVQKLSGKPVVKQTQDLMAQNQVPPQVQPQFATEVLKNIKADYAKEYTNLLTQLEKETGTPLTDVKSQVAAVATSVPATPAPPPPPAASPSPGGTPQRQPQRAAQPQRNNSVTSSKK